MLHLAAKISTSVLKETWHLNLSQDPTNGTMSSSDSLNDELFFGGSEGSTHQSSTRGLQRFGGFENLFEVNEGELYHVA